MIKYTLGVLAVVFAVIAFTSTTDISANKQTRYVWFSVGCSVKIPCGDFSSAVLGDLILVPKSSENVLADLQDRGYVLTRSEAVNEFGCPATTEVCAVGYGLNSSNFEVVVRDGIEYWRPKASASELDKICRQPC